MHWKRHSFILASQTPSRFCCPLLWPGKQDQGLPSPPWHTGLLLNYFTLTKGWDKNFEIAVNMLECKDGLEIHSWLIWILLFTRGKEEGRTWAGIFDICRRSYMILGWSTLQDQNWNCEALTPFLGGAKWNEYVLWNPGQILAGVHKGKDRAEAYPRLRKLVHNCHQGELSTPLRKFFGEKIGLHISKPPLSSHPFVGGFHWFTKTLAVGFCGRHL